MGEQAKWDGQSAMEHLQTIHAPNEFFGACRNHRNCKRFKEFLGNGFCVKCWDRGLGSKARDWDWLPKYG